MEVISTSNLVPSETEKKTACNFQHDFHERPNKKLCVKTHMYSYTKQQNQNQSKRRLINERFLDKQ